MMKREALPTCKARAGGQEKHIVWIPAKNYNQNKPLESFRGAINNPYLTSEKLLAVID